MMGGMMVAAPRSRRRGSGSVPRSSQHAILHNLASIYFQFCFQYISPRFTLLGLLMFSLAMGLNFRTRHPGQPQQQHLILCTH